jgi:hypothetical protein
MGETMTLSSTSKTLEQTLEAIQAMDLTLIKFKATRDEDGYGWSPAYADELELAYKRYLILHAKYPDLMLAPERDVDRFWHMHILDTRKYAADCEAAFGRFLHHFPYLGLRGEDDAKALDDAFETMQQLHLKEFGEPMGQPREAAAACGAEVASAWCGVEPSVQAQAAWCGVEPQQKAHAAWCGVEPSKQQARAAWCGVEPQQAKAAWCGVEPSTKS